MEYLSPTSYEELKLPSGTVCHIPKCEPVFQLWTGVPLPDTSGGKAVLEFNGFPVFAEIAILRCLEHAGWQGVWVDTYRKGYRITNDEFTSLPSEKLALLDQIYDKAQSCSGCFDIFVWRGESILFAESKWKGKDLIRATQLRWLDTALNIGHRVDSFLIVEWDITDD